LPGKGRLAHCPRRGLGALRSASALAPTCTGRRAPARLPLSSRSTPFVSLLRLNSVCSLKEGGLPAIAGLPPSLRAWLVSLRLLCPPLKNIREGKVEGGGGGEIIAWERATSPLSERPGAERLGIRLTCTRHSAAAPPLASSPFLEFDVFLEGFPATAGLPRRCAHCRSMLFSEFCWFLKGTPKPLIVCPSLRARPSLFCLLLALSSRCAVGSPPH